MGNRPVISEKNPQISYALAVTTREEVEKRNQRFKEMGINARHEEFNSDGVSPLKMYSNKARNGVLREMNMRDNDAGYGQYSGE